MATWHLCQDDLTTSHVYDMLSFGAEGLTPTNNHNYNGILGKPLITVNQSQCSNQPSEVPSKKYIFNEGGHTVQMESS